MASIQRRLGARIRQLRTAADLTQEEAAGRVDMYYKYWGAIERGERNVTLDNLERVARALNVEPWELLLFEGAETRVAEGRREAAVLGVTRYVERGMRPLLADVVRTVLRHAPAAKA